VQPQFSRRPAGVHAIHRHGAQPRAAGASDLEFIEAGNGNAPRRRPVVALALGHVAESGQVWRTGHCFRL